MKIEINLVGTRPLLFDRYAGDNKTQLKESEKLYLVDRGLVIPALNVYSLLCAENTKSVTKLFMGKQARQIGMAVSAYADINPMNIPLLDGNGKQIVFTEWNDQIKIHQTVARVAKGIPNPKSRPRVELPWALNFTVDWAENKDCSVETLRNLVDLGGRIGLGTFRPFFGRYKVARFAVE